MKLTVTGKNIEITDAIKNHLSSKMNKVLQSTNDSANCHVTLYVEKHRHMADIIVKIKGFTAYAKEETTNLYTTLDSVLEKIEKQLKKHKARSQNLRKKLTLLLNNKIEN